MERSQSTTDFPVCESLDVDLVIPANLIWVEIVPEEFPSEKWYVTTVSYDCVFELVPNTTYITAPGAKAQFTVRAGGDQWRLVEWRDLGSAASEMAFGSEIAWGAVKLLYQ